MLGLMIAGRRQIGILKRVREGPKERLLAAAIRCFSAGGFHGTGIDRLLADARVAKMSLYKHFRSKEELICAALRRRRELWMNWFTTRSERSSLDPQRRLLAAFDALAEWFATPDFNGCLFVHAAGEFPRLGDPPHQVAADQKRAVFEWVRAQVLQLGVRDVDTLARQLTLLIEGATVTAHVTGEGADAARAARTAASVLLDAQRLNQRMEDGR